MDDNRAAFQAELNTGCLDLRGKPGRYYVDIPATRAIPVLSMPDGASILGSGPDETAIVFRGDPQGRDMACLRARSKYKIEGVSLVVEESGGTWNEQSHLFEIVGPANDGEIAYCILDHPVVPGFRRGDCIRLRGYPPDESGANDRRIWRQRIHHTVFRNAARSGVSLYGGVHDSEFDHCEFLNTKSQDLDQEGTAGDNVNVEWHHNIHRLGPASQSALAVSLYPGSTHLHHNVLDGRGLDMLGGDHHTHHNVVTLRTKSSDPVVYRRKAGTTHSHDETWIRSADAGPGVVFAAAEKLTAPFDVRLEDVTLVQNTAAMTVAVSGVVGVSMRGLQLLDQGPPGARPRDAIRIEGTLSTRTRDVSIVDCAFMGRFRAAVSASGSYIGGVGELEVRDCHAPDADAMLFLENTDPTPDRGGIAGPVIDVDNHAGSQ